MLRAKTACKPLFSDGTSQLSPSLHSYMAKVRVKVEPLTRSWWARWTPAAGDAPSKGWSRARAGAGGRRRPASPRPQPAAAPTRRARPPPGLAPRSGSGCSSTTSTSPRRWRFGSTICSTSNTSTYFSCFACCSSTRLRYRVYRLVSCGGGSGGAALRLVYHAQAASLRPWFQRVGRCCGCHGRPGAAFFRCACQLHATLRRPASHLSHVLSFILAFNLSPSC